MSVGKWGAVGFVLPIITVQLLLGADPELYEVSFASYILRNYLAMERRVNGELVEQAPKPEDEIHVLVEMLQEIEPDILGLVEIGTDEDLADLQKRLAPLDLPYRTIALAWDETRRVGLLSRFPIESTAHQTKLRYPMGSLEIDFHRGILDATLAINDTYRLRVLGTHLKSKREVAGIDQALMRRNEAHLLRHHINQILESDEQGNLLVFGDFNDDRHMAPIKAVQGTYGTPGYMKDVQLADEHGQRWTYYWDHSDQYSRFDYLFANKALLPELRDEGTYIASHPLWYKASDHRPLVLRIHTMDLD